MRTVTIKYTKRVIAEVTVDIPDDWKIEDGDSFCDYPDLVDSIIEKECDHVEVVEDETYETIESVEEQEK